MAKDKRNLDMISSITMGAGLKDQRSSDSVKRVSGAKGEIVKKRKQIELDLEWEKAIKDYYGGTVSSYITMAIREKMQRDKIL